MKSIIIIFLAVTLAVALDESIDNSERIINGKPAAPGQFPYQVGLYFTTNFFDWGWCGGSLISSVWVLTAAHCLQGIWFVEVRLGGIYWDRPELSFWVDYDKFITHEDYDGSKKVNDIALIRIPTVEFTYYIQKIELPKNNRQNSEKAHEKVIVSGWGYIDDSYTPPDSLLYAEMATMRYKDCNKVYGNVLRSMICVRPINYTNTCYGDPGGPMTLSNYKILIGVGSYGGRKCKDGYPSVFTRVRSYLDWIAYHTGIEY